MEVTPDDYINAHISSLEDGDDTSEIDSFNALYNEELTAALNGVNNAFEALGVVDEKICDIDPTDFPSNEGISNYADELLGYIKAYNNSITDELQTMIQLITVLKEKDWTDWPKWCQYAQNEWIRKKSS